MNVGSRVKVDFFRSWYWGHYKIEWVNVWNLGFVQVAVRR